MRYIDPNKFIDYYNSLYSEGDKVKKSFIAIINNYLISPSSYYEYIKYLDIFYGVEHPVDKSVMYHINPHFHERLKDFDEYLMEFILNTMENYTNAGHSNIAKIFLLDMDILITEQEVKKLERKEKIEKINNKNNK